MNKTYYPNWNKKDFAKVEYLTFTADRASTTDSVFGCIPWKQIMLANFPGSGYGYNKYLKVIINGTYTGLNGSSYGLQYWLQDSQQDGSYYVTRNKLNIGGGYLSNNRLPLVYNSNYPNSGAEVLPSAEITSEQLLSGDFNLNVYFTGISKYSEASWMCTVVSDFWVNDVEYTYYDPEAASISAELHHIDVLSVGGGMRGKIKSVEVIVNDFSLPIGQQNVTVCKLTPAKNNNSGAYGLYDEISGNFYEEKRPDGTLSNNNQGPILINNWK